MLAAGWERWWLEGRAVAVRLESESYQATTMPFLNSFLEILPSLLISHCGAEHSLNRGAADEQGQS